MAASKNFKSDRPLVFISAAEPSADLHGAKLIRAVHALEPKVRFVGVAGPLMRDAGCEGIFDMSQHAAMLVGAFKVVPQALSMLRTAKAFLNDQPVDLTIPIDSPMLNLTVAKHAKAAHVPVLYYIAPQVWAWGKNRRLNRVKNRVDRLAVILPFEEPFFREHDIPAEYVGHPLFDTLAQRRIDDERVANLKAKGHPIIAILPGSRTHVVEEVFPGQIEVVQAIRKQHPRAHFCISVANQRVGEAITKRLESAALPHTLHENENGEILTAANLALVASGTATLEIAYYHLPMIVMYNAPRLGYQLLARWFINSKYLSLINILADRELVPEFMPFYKSTEPIIEKALALLDAPETLETLRQDIANTICPLIKTGASENAANIVLKMLRAEDASRVTQPSEQ